MRRRAASARAGMTLLELMMVMFLLALVLGSGLGAFTSLDLGRQQAAGVVRSVIRSAENTAIASHAPARVRIDAKNGTLRAESMLVVGTYRFENQRIEGFGPAGQTEPELFDSQGFVGSCFHPAGKLASTAEIPLQNDPAFDFTLGFSLELALYRESEGAGRVLSIGQAETPTVALELSKGGALRGRFRARVGDALSDKPGGQEIVQSEPGLVPVGRWVQVKLQYDRANLALFLDGALVGSEAYDTYVWKVEAPLVLSDRTLPFPGKIDDLVLGVMVTGEPGVLPDTVHFAPDAPALIQFEAGGGLDRSVHFDPPRVSLDYADGSRQTVVVNLYGTVE